MTTIPLIQVLKSGDTENIMTNSKFFHLVNPFTAKMVLNEIEKILREKKPQLFNDKA